MKRVVVVGIPLNVISTYALSDTGWKTVLEFAFKAQEWCEGFWTSTDALGGDPMAQLVWRWSCQR